MNPSDLQKFEEKYKEKIQKEFNEYTAKNKNINTESRVYQEFKKQWLPKKLSLYEKACNFCDGIFKIQVDKKEAAELQESIDVCHLNITPSGVKSFSYLLPITLILVVSFLSLALPILLNPTNPESGEMFFIVFSIILGIIMIIPLGKLPIFFANSWRMKASNQMVLCVFYMVTYMRHTSNIENAIDFAAEHLPAPLSIDLKKVIWNAQIQKYSTIKESLDAYLYTWKNYNSEFIESVHLIESSLYESSESRRLDSLDKSLSVILEETYEKMLHYAHNLQSPLTMLNMLGIVLPILGLVILPLMVSFMTEVKWYHLFALYNIALPIGVYYMERVILSTRPSGYGSSDISEDNPELKKFKFVRVKFGNFEIKFPPEIFAFTVFIILFLIGISPLLIHAVAPEFELVITKEGNLMFVKGITNCIEEKPNTNVGFALLGYKCDPKSNATEPLGPYGLGAAILSVFIPLSIGIGLGLYFKLKSKNVIKIREETNKIEQEFASALFQLGNRLGDGLPLEIAFTKVAESMEGTTSGQFFELVSINITKLGMNAEEAIFDKHKGALVYYPSNIIESTMKVLIESSKKGPLVASQAVINVSEYIKQMHRVDERLRDLMADTISSLSSQIAFLTPVIAGIVIGITSMITTILGSLTETLGLVTQSSDASSMGATGLGAGAGLTDLFGLGIPAFHFQIIVGIYVVQIIYIMTILVNGIKNGDDKLGERYMLGNNLISSVTLYAIIALIVMLLFNIIASFVLSGIA